MAVKKTTRVSPQKRDEGKKVASRKATSGTVSAATSVSAQKAKRDQLMKPGKVTESGMANIPASIMRLGKVAIDAYKKGTQAGKASAKPSAPKSNVKKLDPSYKPTTKLGGNRLAREQAMERANTKRSASADRLSKYSPKYK